MFVVMVMYPTTPGGRFDMEYYIKTHMKLVQARWQPMGLQDWKVLRSTGTADGSEPPYQVTAMLTFASQAEFKAAGRAHAPEIMGDIANFTDIAPVMLFTETVA
jgi:uncharacterized protein (TIGR02118 family)